MPDNELQTRSKWRYIYHMSRLTSRIIPAGWATALRRTFIVTCEHPSSNPQQVCFCLGRQALAKPKINAYKSASVFDVYKPPTVRTHPAHACSCLQIGVGLRRSFSSAVPTVVIIILAWDAQHWREDLVIGFNLWGGNESSPAWNFCSMTK